MKIEKINSLEKEQAKERFKYDMPLVFSIPRPYEDAIKERDKEMHFRVQNLRQQYQHLKAELHNYSEIYEKRYTQTRQAIQMSNSLLQKLINKGKTLNHGIAD